MPSAQIEAPARRQPGIDRHHRVQENYGENYGVEIVTMTSFEVALSEPFEATDVTT